MRNHPSDAAHEIRPYQPPAPSRQTPAAAELAAILDRAQPADVEVIDPRTALAHLLRHDAPNVLERLGVFIFDEAQHMKEATAGSCWNP
jgi:hypothetical protein